MSEPSSDVNPLDVLAEEFVTRHRAGEHPSLDEFIARRPDLADDIRDLFPGLVLMEGVRPAPGDVTGPFEAGAAVSMLKRLGDYRVLREVGRGGMGVVYEAEQESLGRHVALKVLPAHSLLEPQRLRRFQREAKAAARLHHTNIVPVYGVGEADGLHYYVMQFIQGLGLDQVLAELRKLRPAPAVEDAPPPSGATASAASAAQSMLTGRFETAPAADGESTPDPGGSSSVRLPGQVEGAPPSRTGREYWRSVARVGVQVGDALAYAHSQGVLHRDVKPSNLLLDARGSVWVTDFGLAKAADGEDLTHTGDIVGTLRYMAPECFSGKGDARADVYSLGLTLYELLTLRPAFVGKDRNQLLAQAMHGEAPRPRSVNRDVPRDLETVVLKAIARDPAHRYATAAELASDLRRFVDDRPVRARRVGWAELAWRWGRRNPVVTGLAAAVLLLLIVGTAGSTVAAYYFSRLADAQGKLRADADTAKGQVQKQADELRDGIERMNRANDLMDSGRLHENAAENTLALANYDAAVEQRPDMSAALLTRGQLYTRFYCWDDAAADFERGFALHPPTDPNLWLWHAYLRVYVGDADGYRRACAAMLDKFGQTTDPATKMDIAQACTAGPDALPDYSYVIRLMDAIDPGDHFALERDYRLALLYYRAGKIDQAIGMIEDKSLNRNDAGFPGFAAVYHLAHQDEKARKTMADFEQKTLDVLLDRPVVPSDDPGAAFSPLDIEEYLHYRETLQLLDGATAVQHPAEPLHSGLGHAALGQLDKATADLDRAVALRPDHAGLRLQRGRVLAQLNRWDEAAADFHDAIHAAPEDQRAVICGEIAAADPHLSAALMARWPDDGWVWAARAKRYAAAAPPAWAEAEADYAKAVELLPNEAGLRYDRGRMYTTEGKWGKLAADFDAAIKLREPADEAGWVDIMMKLAAAGDRDVFRRAADRMLALYGNSKNPVELQQTAECCMMLPDACSDPKGCLRAAKQAYAADQGVWNTTTLALAQYRNGQFEPAASFLNSYLDHLPDGASEQDRLILQLLLGMSERKAGRDKEARTELQPALQRLNEIVPATDAAGIRTYDPWQALRSEATELLKEAESNRDK